MSKLPNSKMIKKIEILPRKTKKKEKREPKRKLMKWNQFMPNFANTFYINNMSDVLELFIQLVYKQELSVPEKWVLSALFPEHLQTCSKE